MVTSYHSDGSFLSKSEYSYDDLGNMIEETNYEEDGSVAHTLGYSYDEQGNVTKITAINAFGILQSETQFKRMDNGKVTEKIEYFYGELEYKTTYKYNEHGFLSESATYDAHDAITSLYRYEYSYDGYGNWIEMVKVVLKSDYSDDSCIFDRTYEYFQ